MKLGEFVPAIALPDLRRARGGRAPRKRMCDIAALFVDIEGCTRQCEDLPPRLMNDVIETYFSSYLDAVRTFDGEVTEVLGDGLLAIFEGPDLRESIEAAMNATDRIRTVTAVLNQRRSRRHDPIAIHIGLSAGQALTGVTRLRSREGERWFYAANGPVTNIAARLCALAIGGQALTTKAVADLVPGRCDFRRLGPQHLKNVARPVEVVECIPKRLPAPQA
jgi:class 3 adenylate cyclase